jgi:hypothetical protein
MGIEDVIVGGLIFKGKKESSNEDKSKVKTKAKKATYIRGLHGSGAAKMKAEIRTKRANRHKK